MTKHTVSIRALSPSLIEKWREAGDAFTAASMSGVPHGEHGRGWLEEDWFELMREHVIQGVDYTIYSYATPIAWHTGTGWVIVTQTFSQTTGARHQSQVRYLQPQRDVWCLGGGERTVSHDDDRLGCPKCTLTVGERKRVVPAHLALASRRPGVRA